MDYFVLNCTETIRDNFVLTSSVLVITRVVPIPAVRDSLKEVTLNRTLSPNVPLGNIFRH